MSPKVLTLHEQWNVEGLFLLQLLRFVCHVSVTVWILLLFLIFLNSSDCMDVAVFIYRVYLHNGYWLDIEPKSFNNYYEIFVYSKKTLV